MKSIIDFIYDSDVFCINDTSNMGKEYDTTMKELCEIEEALCRCYPDCYHILSEYISKQGEIVTMTSRHSFEMGFKAGALLMIEIIGDSVK